MDISQSQSNLNNSFAFFKKDRKSDRHKLSSSVRLKNLKRKWALIQELGKRGFCFIHGVSQDDFFSQKWWFSFSPQAYIYSKRYLLFFFAEPSKEIFEWVYQFRKNEKELMKVLEMRPLLFRKKIEQLEKELKVVNQHWRPHRDIIETIDKIPQTKGYQLNSHYERRDLSCLLLKNKEAGGKNKTVLDFDHYKKDKWGNYIFTAWERNYLNHKFICLINKYKIPWHEISPSGSPKLHLNLTALLPKSKMFTGRGKVFGDVLGLKSQTRLPISQGCQMKFTKWAKKTTELPLIETEKFLKELEEIFYIFLDGNKVKGIPSKKSISNKSIEQAEIQVKNVLEVKENNLVDGILKVEAVITKKEFIGEVNYLPHMRKVVKIFYRAINQIKPYFLADIYYRSQEQAINYLREGATANIRLKTGRSQQFFYARW
jgi:hypothetical protein